MRGKHQRALRLCGDMFARSGPIIAHKTEGVGLLSKEQEAIISISLGKVVKFVCLCAEQRRRCLMTSGRRAIVPSVWLAPRINCDIFNAQGPPTVGFQASIELVM